MPRSVFTLEKAADGKDVLEGGLELKFKRKADRIACQVLQQEGVDERQIFSRSDPLPTDFDRVFQQQVAIGVQVRIGQSERGHEPTIGIADQQFRFPAAYLELVAVEKTAIVVVKAESVSRSQRNGAIGLTQEEQISVFDDKCFSDAAFDGMNLGDEIRGFFSSNRARRRKRVALFSHDSRKEINAFVANVSAANSTSKIGP